MEIRIVKGLVNPIVLDPSEVTLHLDAAIFAADPFSGFTTNETTFRLEAPAVLVARSPGAIHVVEGRASS